jgi:TRAP-type C4-dicarboxylate transport system substrate-binding protein
MIERGDIELANSIQGYYPGRFPQSSVIELPMLFADAVTGSRALMALYREGLLDKDYAALKVLSLSVAPPCSIFTTGKKITTTRDLRGLRIRVPSPTVGLPLARLGAIPLGMPLSMIGEAIANGTINAMAFALDAGIGFKGANGKPIADDMSVVLDLDFAAPAVMTVMNRAAWDALPSDLQVTLETGGAAAGMEAAQVSDRGQAFAREKFKANPNYTYILPSTELRAEFQSTMVRSFDDWQTNMNRTGIDGARLLTRTRELVKQYAVAEK